MDVPSWAWALTITAFTGPTWSSLTVILATLLVPSVVGLARSRQQVLRSSPAEDDVVEKPAPALR